MFSTRYFLGKCCTIGDLRDVDELVMKAQGRAECTRLCSHEKPRSPMRWLVLVLAALGAEKTPPGVTEKQMEEFGKDFKDFDKNQDDLVDPQEVRHGFGGKLSEAELFEFYRDADVDWAQHK